MTNSDFNGSNLSVTRTVESAIPVTNCQQVVRMDQCISEIAGEMLKLFGAISQNRTHAAIDVDVLAFVNIIDPQEIWRGVGKTFKKEFATSNLLLRVLSGTSELEVRLYARDQLTSTEGFDQIIVRAMLQPSDA